MKTMKLASVAMLAMVGLGFATPASATVAGGGQSGTAEAKVTIQGAIGNKQKLILKSVPTEYNFVTTLEESTYDMVSTTLTNSKIEVHKNYTAGGVKGVYVSISNLKINKSSTDFVTPTAFQIEDVGLVGTGISGRLYNDEEFHSDGKTSGTLSKDITKANISFSKDGLTVGDKLTGEVTYTIGNYVAHK